MKKRGRRFRAVVTRDGVVRFVTKWYATAQEAALVVSWFAKCHTIIIEEEER